MCCAQPCSWICLDLLKQSSISAAHRGAQQGRWRGRAPCAQRPNTCRARQDARTCRCAQRTLPLLRCASQPHIVTPCSMKVLPKYMNCKQDGSQHRHLSYIMSCISAPSSSSIIKPIFSLNLSWESWINVRKSWMPSMISTSRFQGGTSEWEPPWNEH